MNESNYTQSIHKLLPSYIYKWKINASFAKGVPDAYYSSTKSDIWIEYKYLKSIPARCRIIPNLSRLQYKWLTSRLKEGRNVAVIVGTPDGSYVLKKPLEWSEGIDASKRKALSKREIASWIEQQVYQGVQDEKVK